MRSRESFNKAAKLYDEVRPSYPDEVIDWIIERSKINPSHELLEIAPGTGQATRKFVERDYTIHAIELGDKLAELLRINMEGKKVSVDISPFETWEPLSYQKKYKLIYCATAWHWLDPKVKYKKVYDLLDNKGILALIWNSALGSCDDQIMDNAFQLLFAYHDNKKHSTKPKNKEQMIQEKKQLINNIEESNHLKVKDYFEYKWSMMQSKDQFIKGFYSQSFYLSLSDEEKIELTPKLESLFNDLEYEIETYFVSSVYLCKKNYEVK